MWQRGLEARILLQRQLAGANRLPQGAMQAAAAASDPQLDAAYRGLAADASALLDDMLQLLGALAEQNPAIGEAAAAAGVAAPEARGGAGGDAQQAAQQQGQRGSEALWERLDAAYAGVAPFRDASIDRWHRKTALTSGAAAVLPGGSLLRACCAGCTLPAAVPACLPTCLLVLLPLWRLTGLQRRAAAHLASPLAQAAPRCAAGSSRRSTRAFPPRWRSSCRRVLSAVHFTSLLLGSV